jgi:hypothetical protein
MSRFTIPIRLFAAFLCGWLFAFLNVFNALLSGSCATESLRIKNEKTRKTKLLTASLLDIPYSLE